MSLGFWISDVCLVSVQSALVALPRGQAPAPVERLATRLSGRGWALVPLASIVLVVVAIGAASAVADGLAWLALIAVPPLAAAALGAILIGLIQAWNEGLPWHMPGSDWTETIVFSILILILIFRPEGLLGERTPEGG
jgi:hypothetical protein